ncbi:Ribosomal-protein-alanine acetyltransferase [invertebrate metagenome]|uniref:Ribosomal-protein-alanine acetyltransferase n=1 Tax=invertebrate metagenome TaxID=1711999 RepID=A0A2H9TCG4_9ZZZZ
MLNFRPMTENDLPVVCSIEQSAGHYPWHESHIQSSLSSGYTCIVALQNKLIIGYGILMYGVDEAELLILTVKKNEQKKGYGRQLLKYLMEQAAQEARRIFLEVRQSNRAALFLYRGIGFLPVGIRKNYYPDGDGREDAVVMMLECPSAMAMTDKSFPCSNKE